MTVRKKFETILTSRGMWPEQARETMDIAIPVIDGKDDYKITWNRPSNEYPNELYAVLFLTIRPIALQYIDDNMLDAFFRDMFTH